MTLVILAHGTGNPAGARTVEAVAARVRLRLRGTTVRTAYVGRNRPALGPALGDVADDAVVVPLPCCEDLAQTARLSLPGESSADSLGPDRLVAGVMAARLLRAGARPGTPVILLAAGASRATTQGSAVRAAQLLEEVWHGPVRAAHLTGRGQRMSEVVEGFRSRGQALPAVAPYLVAPGHFATRAREDARMLGLDLVADVLGDHPHVAEAIARRYRATIAHRFALSLA